MQVVREEDLREIEREALLLATEEGLAGRGASEVVTSLLEDLERSREEHAEGNAALQFKLRALEEATAGTPHTLHTTHYTLHTTHYTLRTTHYTLHTRSYTIQIWHERWYRAPNEHSPQVQSLTLHIKYFT